MPACSATMYSAYQSGQFGSAFADALLVLAVGGHRTPKRARQIARRIERRRRGVDPAEQPRRNLREQPGVAVRVAERGIRGVGTALRIWTVEDLASPRRRTEELARAASMSDTAKTRRSIEPGWADNEAPSDSRGSGKQAAVQIGAGGIARAQPELFDLA